MEFPIRGTSIFCIPEYTILLPNLHHYTKKSTHLYKIMTAAYFKRKG
jgi:hypothetical protein